MKSTKTRALIVLVLLALGSAWLVPGVAGAGKKKDPKKGLARRVEVLEEQVAELMARVEVLEGGSCTHDVIHLEPRDDFPGSPSDVTLCAVEVEDSGRYALYCYVNGEWMIFAIGPIGPGPSPTPPRE